MKKPTLIVVCRPNGSGKTSITRKILKHEWCDSATYFNPDVYCIMAVLSRIQKYDLD